MAIIVKCNNGIVTDRYLEIIGKSLEKIGINFVFTSDVNEVLSYNKSEIVVVARIVDAFPLLLRGYKNVVMWFQGVEPEESFMNHNSKIRMMILNIMEKYILKNSKFILLVSNKMKEHYEEKYNISLHGKYYVMPCLNTDIHPEAFNNQFKYITNNFVYIGSMAMWQKFDETVRIYKMVEKSGLVKSPVLRVYTSEQEKALEVLKKYNINNFSINFVNNDKLSNELVDVKYGFIIREDNIVNRVATPTKISTYLSCGIIPIYSECLSSFNEISKNMKYTIRYSENDFISKIINMQNVNVKEIFSEYNQVFEGYYSEEYHVNNISNVLKHIFNNKKTISN